MGRGRGKRLSPAFKACGALEVAKSHKTGGEIAEELQVHPIQTSQWNRQSVLTCASYSCRQCKHRARKTSLGALTGVANNSGGIPPHAERRGGREVLCEEIGRFRVELDFLKNPVSSGDRPMSGRAGTHRALDSSPVRTDRPAPLAILLRRPSIALNPLIIY